MDFAFNIIFSKDNGYKLSHLTDFTYIENIIKSNRLSLSDIKASILRMRSLDDLHEAYIDTLKCTDDFERLTDRVELTEVIKYDRFNVYYSFIYDKTAGEINPENLISRTINIKSGDYEIIFTMNNYYDTDSCMKINLSSSRINKKDVFLSILNWIASNIKIDTSTDKSE